MVPVVDPVRNPLISVVSRQTGSQTGWVGCGAGWTGPGTDFARKGPVLPPTDLFGFLYKRGLFPNGFLGFLSMFFTSIAAPLELASSPTPPTILASF